MAASRNLRGDGLVEYLLVLALFALAAVGTVAIFGDGLRDLFGIAPPATVAPASAPGAPAASP
jgi:Flp pilus assembly pilin Flp